MIVAAGPWFAWRPVKTNLGWRWGEWVVRAYEERLVPKPGGVYTDVFPIYFAHSHR
jgi:hypothetical protein